MVVTHDIPLGMVFSSDDLRLVEVPLELIPGNAVRNIETAIGRFSKVDMVAGEMVLNHHLADPTNISHDLAFIIGDDAVLMAFPMEDLMSQINILQPGDQVDILVSLNVPVIEEQAGLLAPAPQETQEPEEILFTFSALQRVVISAVIVEITETRTRGTSVTGETAEGTPQPTPTVAPSQIEARALLLALSPQDAWC